MFYKDKESVVSFKKPQTNFKLEPVQEITKEQNLTLLDYFKVKT